VSPVKYEQGFYIPEGDILPFNFICPFKHSNGFHFSVTEMSVTLNESTRLQKMYRADSCCLVTFICLLAFLSDDQLCLSSKPVCTLINLLHGQRNSTNIPALPQIIRQLI
jgi:hypothetical protein